MTISRPVAALALVACCSCGVRVVNESSNFPDSGISCDADAGGGTGALSGEGAFVVRSAFEQVQSTVQVDSGVVQARSLGISLLSVATSCGGRRSELEWLSMSLFDPSGIWGPGEYSAVSDGGRGTLVVMATLDGGVRVATSGVVRLTAIEACSLTGTFDVGFANPDGGQPDAGRFTGTFAPTYCPE